MTRLGDFLAGMVIGAALLFVAMKFHVVRANDGAHLVPKITAEFKDAYVDIRQFTFADWDKHRALAVAIVRANKSQLMDDSVRHSAENTLQGLLGQSAAP